MSFPCKESKWIQEFWNKLHKKLLSKFTKDTIGVQSQIHPQEVLKDRRDTGGIKTDWCNPETPTKHWYTQTIIYGMDNQQSPTCCTENYIQYPVIKPY